MTTSTHWKDLIADKQQRQAESLPKEWIIQTPPPTLLDVTHVPESCDLLTERELHITNTSDVELLLKKLSSAEWSAVEVTTAYYKRAIVAQQLTNCLTEIFVERALLRAAQLDEHLKKTGKVMGPLHGLPISLKDQLCIKGLETTMGYASWIGKYAEKDAVLVEILYDAGAVPFVRTNTPQTLMWAETYNAIFGRTTNPWNRDLTSGGSSGGEGALIALKGSPLGVGSDIGGSIRIPSAFCGLYGFRPSYHRIPYSGAVNSMEGQETIPSVLGPMSASVNGIRLFMRAVLDARPWTRDPVTLRKPWDEDAYRLVEHGNHNRMCFAIMWHDGTTMPHPPIRRALNIAKQALLSAGHEVIDWEPLKVREVADVTYDIWDAGWAEDLAAVIAESKEPIIASMEIGQENKESDKAPSLSAFELWQRHKKLRNLRQEYLDTWQATVQRTSTGRPIDAIIAPAAPYAAPPHGKNKNAVYTTMWNALNYPAMVIPVTRVSQELDVKQPPHEFLHERDRKNYDWYHPKIFENAPVAIQLVGQTLEDEAVIGMSEVVDRAIRTYQTTEQAAKL